MNNNITLVFYTMSRKVFSGEYCFIRPRSFNLDVLFPTMSPFLSLEVVKENLLIETTYFNNNFSLGTN